jgi:glycogen operon protein
MSTEAVLKPGRCEVLGAHAREGGVNFAVHAAQATAVELCLFDELGESELRRLLLHGPRDGVWHGFLPGAAPGLVYGLRAHGPYAPTQGQRFNPHKLLLDPYAREIVGRFEWRPEHHGYVLGEGAHSFDRRDNARTALKARVAAPLPPLQSPPPRVPDGDLVLYEVHVKGFSAACAMIPDGLRGTYAALAHPAALAHFRRLGVSTLSLLPVHYHLDEPMLQGSGRVNYWGYNTLGFFCPDPRLSCTPHDPSAVNQEFRAMVDALHRAGLEVLIDVVFNHTAEGSHEGATISFRGLDHASWYRLDAQGRCINWSACGNTLNVAEPRVTQFILDSLRHWVQEMGVDGFRFDLAATLGRTRDGAFDPECAFFTALRQDPLLARVKLIAEPWDSGPQGYRMGAFPPPWLDWNDQFRDAARSYWLGLGGDAVQMAARFNASPDLFAGRRPSASVNFVAVHDGFTLADFTAFAAKHNHANGEGNRDGRDDELCAALSGERQRRVRRALLATLLLAQGTPMLCAGDEFGNSQQGNNNAWNQDNATGWLDWSRSDQGLMQLVEEALTLRRNEPALRDDRRHERPLKRLGDAAFALQVADLSIVFNPEPDELPWPAEGDWQVVFDSSGTAPTRCIPAHTLVVLRAQ